MLGDLLAKRKSCFHLTVMEWFGRNIQYTIEVGILAEIINKRIEGGKSFFLSNHSMKEQTSKVQVCFTYFSIFPEM